VHLFTVMCETGSRLRGTSVAFPPRVFTLRPTRIRGLSFYRAQGGRPPGTLDSVDEELDELVHARSRFRSVVDPELFAAYSVHDVRATPPPEALASRHHTLMVVREFRRVPLDASALALAVLRARGGCVAGAIAAVAHWAERAVSLAEPAYLLVAHSLEEPRLIVLLTGVHECQALLDTRASAFSLDSLLAEADGLLMSEPDWYAYCAPRVADTLQLISPSAV
jgi:hypothetical protein